MRSRILLAVSISICLLLYYTKDGRACSVDPTEHEEYRVGLFVPYSAQLRTYDGMYFSFFPMHDHENEQGVETDRQINVGEWYEYLHHQVSRADIYKLLYETSPTNFEDALSRPQDTLGNTLCRNTFFQYLHRPDNKKVLAYMRHAKINESYTGGSADPWDDNFHTGSPQTLENDTLAKEFEAVVDDNFLRARYLYLDVRWSNYIPAYPDTTFYFYHDFSAYEKLMQVPGKTIVKNWAAYFEASVTDEPALRCYLMSRAFNLSNDKKSPAFRHFDPDHVGYACKYARNKREVADLYSLAAMKRSGDAVDLIQKVYNLDPSDPNLPFLLVREINKLEDLVLTPHCTGFGPQVGNTFYDPIRRKNLYTTTAQHMDKWKACLANMLASSQPHDRFFLNLCMAHTCLIDSRSADARTYLDSADKYPAPDPELMYQYKLTDLAIKINTTGRLDEKFESETLPTLLWLERNKKHLENSDLVLKQIHLFLSKKYEQQGDKAKALMCRTHYQWFYQVDNVPSAVSFNIDSSMYLYMQESCSGAEVESFVNLLRRKNKSAFERYYTAPLAVDSYVYNMACNAAGSDYMREADYAGGLRMFSLIQDRYWHEDHIGEVMNTYMAADPFIAYPEDNHLRSMTIRDSTKRYTKKTMAQRLVRLIREDSNKPDSLIRIADAVYNMSYFGNSWIMTRNCWSAYDYVFNREDWWWNTGTMAPRYYDYYGCRRARQWYQQAYQRSANKEIKAKALLMMAQCDKNYAYAISQGKYHGSTALFDQFARSYADTRYYQDLTSTCEIRQVKECFYQFIP